MLTAREFIYCRERETAIVLYTLNGREKPVCERVSSPLWAGTSGGAREDMRTHK